MDLLSIVSKLEQTGYFNRVVENIIRLNGFRDVTVPVWKVNDGISDLSITVDGVTVDDVWKCFVVDDLEGIWYFVVMKKFDVGVRGRFSHELFVLVDISSVDVSAVVE